MADENNLDYVRSIKRGVKLIEEAEAPGRFTTALFDHPAAQAVINSPYEPIRSKDYYASLRRSEKR